MSEVKHQFPKLFKYMTINHNINYIDPNFKKCNDKFVNVIEYPQNLAFTNQSWYENGSSDFLYYPYNYRFGAPDSRWNDNYGGFMN